MISSIQVALQCAIDVISPPATPLQDFTYHWKQLMNFYVSQLTSEKVLVENTGIPRHLNVVLEALLQEEKEKDEPGPCLEYFLQHKLLDLLATLASTETLPGMRTVCFVFLRKLLGRSKHPLLHYACIYTPIQRLIALCNGNPPSPIEIEEVQFLLTICSLVCKCPHVTNIINDVSNEQSADNDVERDNEQTEMQKVTYMSTRRKYNFNPLFDRLDTQTITLMNPNIFEKDQKRLLYSSQSFKMATSSLPNSPRSSNDFVSSRDESVSSSPRARKPESPAIDARGSNERWEDKCEEHFSENKIEEQLQNLRDLRLSTGNNVYDASYVASDSSLKSPKMPEKSKCLLLDALMSYLNSADDTVRIRACEGIMALASLEDPLFARTVARSELSLIISHRLENLFNTIPAYVDHLEIYNVNVTWGLDSPLWTKENMFSGCRQVAAFFRWFDYCDQLINQSREARTEVAETLARNIRLMFFDRIVTPALADHHVVLITALVAKCLKEITSSILCTEISYWLVGQDRDPEIPNVWSSSVLHQLIENCFTNSNDLTIETLRLFGEAVDKRNEHLLHCLLLVYLSTRAYYDNTAIDSTIASWSDEENEREKERECPDFPHEQIRSRTLAPNNIHRIINCFLSLMPHYLQTNPDVNNYEEYMSAWEQEYSSMLPDCSLMAWPLEAITIDDSASSDSRPEADHCSVDRFYMGPFLSMLLDKVSNIPKQTYEVNLEVTGLISRLALLPHPYLHEFLLNPLLPLVSGAKNLFLCLQKVVKQLVERLPKTPETKEKLRAARKRLLSDFYRMEEEEEEETVLYASVIVIEEFCKDLAAIAYVKYHLYLTNFCVKENVNYSSKKL